MLYSFLATGIVFGPIGSNRAAIDGRDHQRQALLIRELEKIQNDILELEKSLVQTGRRSGSQQRRLQKIKRLISLHRKEKKLTLSRKRHLKKTLIDLERRKRELSAKVEKKQKSIRDSLSAIYLSFGKRSDDLQKLVESEITEVPRRVVMRRLVNREIRNIEAIRVDIEDLEALKIQIQDEEQYLNYLAHDLKEQEELLKFHSKLQKSMIRKDYTDRMKQLEHYRKLKDSESQIATLIQQFNARKEFQKLHEMEGKVSESILKGKFVQNKGMLKLPIDGKIISSFGQHYDPKSQLQVFRKGIEIVGKKDQEVRAVFDGRVVFSGVLPRYGQVTILDHGSHHYSLCAQLGQLTRKTGDFVSSGDVIGISDKKGKPIYFEIRKRNVALNPLQWISL